MATGAKLPNSGINLINNTDVIDVADINAISQGVESVQTQLNAQGADDFTINSTNKAQTFKLVDFSMYVIRCVGVATTYPVYLGHVSTSGGNIYLHEIKASGISVSSTGLDLTITTDGNYVRIHIERLKIR